MASSSDWYDDEATMAFHAQWQAHRMVWLLEGMRRVWQGEGVRAFGGQCDDGPVSESLLALHTTHADIHLQTLRCRFSRVDGGDRKQ